MGVKEWRGENVIRRGWRREERERDGERQR